MVHRLEHNRRLAASDLPYHTGEIVHCHGAARAANVVTSSNANIAFHCKEGPAGEVIDIAPCADLRAVVVNDQLVAYNRPPHEMMDRADSDLVRSVDVERTQGHGGH